MSESKLGNERVKRFKYCLKKQEKEVFNISNGSCANLKSHLGHFDGMADFLQDSQKKNEAENKTKLSVDLKKKLDQAILVAVVCDSRSFSDFGKKGIK